MPRKARNAPAGFVYHALNRAVARLPLFQKDGDFEAFERVLAEALEEHPTRGKQRGRSSIYVAASVVAL